MRWPWQKAPEKPPTIIPPGARPSTPADEPPATLPTPHEAAQERMRTFAELGTLQERQARLSADQVSTTARSRELLARLARYEEEMAGMARPPVRRRR